MSVGLQSVGRQPGGHGLALHERALHRDQTRVEISLGETRRKKAKQI